MNVKLKTKLRSLGWKMLRLLTRFHNWVHWYFSCERKNPYRCNHCGSTDIQVKAWINPNRGNSYISDMEDRECWCDACERHGVMIDTDQFLEWADNWWINLELFQKLVIKGIVDPEFDGPENTEGECDEMWENLTDDKKIEIYSAHGNDQQ